METKRQKEEKLKKLVEEKLKEFGRPPLTDKMWEIRRAAESDLYKFIKLVAPHRVLGHVHEELIRWWQSHKRKSHQLVLLPRDHGKSTLIAYRVIHHIVKNPDTRILYVSSTAALAEQQLGLIKDVITSPIFTKYFPEYIHPDEKKRKKWAAGSMSIDHPLRSVEGIRDPTVLTAGLTSSITGFHCDVAVLDDFVVYENAYTQEGRDKVRHQYNLLSSIEGAEAQEWVVGTRYHPKDLYQYFKDMEEEVHNEAGEIISKRSVFDIFERVVEDTGDGTGEFLWPRQRRSDGKWFGFNTQILARKKAKYKDNPTQFRAQYYNDPNDISSAAIQRSMFQYYDRTHLNEKGGHWYYKDRKLNVFAAIDFAFSTKKKADFTSIVVVGVDCDRNYYILDIERFKTGKIKVYFDKLVPLASKWKFKKLKAEVTIAQQVIVNELKEEYLKPYGLPLSITEHRPTRHGGTKEERIQAALEPKYANGAMWHYRGGNCEILEEELILQNPPHDDIKDCLASCVEECVPPMDKGKHKRKAGVIPLNTHSRFGGISF